MKMLRWIWRDTLMLPSLALGLGLAVASPGITWRWAFGVVVCSGAVVWASIRTRAEGWDEGFADATIRHDRSGRS